LSPHKKFQGLEDIAEGSAPSETNEEPAGVELREEINMKNWATGK
jgi:hypothetical protein